MVSSSLLEYLRTKTSIDEESLKTIIFKNEEPKNDYDKAKVLSALFELKILDPACGSGAFPMGLLQKIVKILKLIDLDAKIWFGLQNKEFRHIHKDRNKDYIRKLSIIKNTIYGIDIQPIAIEISKLRFFLSLIVDEEGEPEPLPNLEFKFVCANSLLPFPFTKQKMQQTTIFDNTNNLNEIYKEIKTIKDKYFESASSTKLQIKQEYKEAQTKLLNEIIALGDGDVSLVGYDPFDPLSVAGFFDSDFMFNLKDGFDIVIGNPPYLGEKGNKETFAPLKQLKYYQGKMDLFYFFFHVGLDNLKDGGILSLITTNYYITATGAVKLRNDLKERATVLNLINFNELKIFESALGQHNLITTLQKGKFDKLAHTSIVNAKGYLGTEVLQSIVEGKNKDTNYYQIPQEKLFNGGNIQLTSGGIDDILDSMAIKSDLLGDISEINQGILSGADTLTDKHIEKFGNLGEKGDGIFVLDLKNPRDLKIFNSISEDEKYILKPFYKNSDIKKYFGVAENTKFIIYITKKTDISKYPVILKHLEKFKNILQEKRETKEGKLPWYSLHWARDEKIFETDKITFPRRAKLNIFQSETNKQFEQSDIMIITKPKNGYSLKFILAILNSKLIYKWLYYRGKRKGEMLELYQEPLSKIPIIKDVSKIEQQPFIDLVDKIMELKKVDSHVKHENDEVRELENKIDEMVYNLYGLSEDEIKVVEGRE
jgi:adenine-specific DNA-methyltransferase